MVLNSSMHYVVHGFKMVDSELTATMTDERERDTRGQFAEETTDGDARVRVSGSDRSVCGRYT
jgi:hypothetical protein